MGRVQIVIRAAADLGEPSGGPGTQFDSASVEAALLVSDINLDRGTAELFADGKRIARLTKRGIGHAPYWEVG